MKIVYVLRDITDYGGIQQVTCLLINSLLHERKNYTISTVSLYNKYAVPAFKLNDDVTNYTLFEKEVDTKKQFINIKCRLKKILRNLNPDIIVVQGIAFTNYLSHSIFQNSRVVACEHGHYHMSGKYGLHWFGIKRALKYADAVVTLTDLDARNYREQSSSKTIIKRIYNPCIYSSDFINTDHSDSKIIVSCGTLDSIKRFDHAVNAAQKVFSKHPDWKWYIYGDGETHSKLQDLINQKNLKEHVILKGNEKNKNLIYGDKAFLVVTSKFEGFGMVLIEAMQYCLPVVSYNVDYGPKEIIEDGVNGFLVADGNVDALSSAIIKLIENKKDYLEMCSKSGQSLQKFKDSEIVQQWIDLFETILKNGDGYESL